MPLKRMSGFSLLELMSVVSIIGILTVIAIPSYQGYAQRARFAEVVAATEVFKLAVAVALQRGVPMEELGNGVHGIPGEPRETKNLAGVRVENGVIRAVGTDLVGGASYILRPDHDGSHWSVSGSCLKSGLCHA